MFKYVKYVVYLTDLIMTDKDKPLAIDDACNLIQNIPDIIQQFRDGSTIENLAIRYEIPNLVIEEIIRLGFHLYALDD